MTLMASPAASADSLAALKAQRAALQAQVHALGASQASALEQLQLVQDRLADLRRQLAKGQAELGDLQARRQQIEREIAANHRHQDQERRALDGVVRQQYKSMDQLRFDQLYFGSANLNEILNRIAAARAIGDKAHKLISELHAIDARLATETADLGRRQSEIDAAQAELNSRRAAMQSTANDYKTRLNGLNEAAAALEAQIKKIDAQIAAANMPPPGASGYTQQQIIAIIHAAADKWHVDRDKMVRVARCESGLNPRAYDAASGASGLFQFMPGTFYGNGGHDIWDPYDQSDIACKMFSQGRGGAWSCQ